MVAMNAEESLKRLIAGNERHVRLRMLTGDFSPERRQKTASEGQFPFAVVIACSDSRVIPEAIFDCGVGEIFVIRTAGNTVGENELGSVGYAVSHLGCKLVIVLGHTCCGAVGAALSGEAEGYVAPIVKKILDNISGETDPAAASAKNASAGAEELSEKVGGEGIRIIPAVCDISSGRVEFLG